MSRGKIAWETTKFIFQMALALVGYLVLGIIFGKEISGDIHAEVGVGVVNIALLISLLLLREKPLRLLTLAKVLVAGLLGAYVIFWEHPLDLSLPITVYSMSDCLQVSYITIGVGTAIGVLIKALRYAFQVLTKVGPSGEGTSS